MLELFNSLGSLLWTIISSTFSLYKQLSGIQNQFVAAALGVSPIVAGVLIFVFKRIKKYASQP